MQQRSSAPLIMPWPLLVSLLGLVFCAWSAYGNAFQICLSAGCEMSKDMAIGGISLWWFGCAAFATLIILSFSGRPVLGVVVAGIFLVGDAALLILMLMTASCISCLIVAIFFALAYTAFRYAGKGYDPIGRSWLILFWWILFVANLGGVLRENMTPWAMVGPQEPTVNVYFSPTCPACMDALKAMASNPKAAFYPVLKKESEFALVAHMADALAEGKNIEMALAYAKEPRDTLPKQGFFSSLLLRVRLLFNGAYLMRNGINVVPVIEYKGLPAFLTPKKEAASEPRTVDPNAPTIMEKIPAGSLQTPDGLEPEVFLGNGAFTYIENESVENSDSSGQSGAMSRNSGIDTPGFDSTPTTGQDTDIDLLIDTGVAGACGGQNAEPCPE